MADEKLSNLTPANSAGGEDYIYVVQSGASRRATVEMVRAPTNAPFNTIRPLITPISGGFAYDLGAWTNAPTDFLVSVRIGSTEVHEDTGPGEYLFAGNEGQTFTVSVTATNSVDSTVASSLPYASAGTSAPSAISNPTILGVSTRPVNAELEWTPGEFSAGVPEGELVRTVRANGVTIDTNPANPWPSAGRTAGEIITIHEVVTNTAGSASATSNAITLTAAISPDGTLTWPTTGDLIAGVAYDCPFDLIEGTSVWWQGYNDSTPVGSNLAIDETDEPTVSVTPNAAGPWTLRLFDADGGNLIYTSPSRPVLSATDAITVATVGAGPFTPEAPVPITGTYAGSAQADTISIQWLDVNDADAPFGDPIVITNGIGGAVIADGAWAATVAAPDTAGDYKPEASFAAVSAEGATIEVSGTAGSTLQTLVFEGFGNPSDDVAIFGTAFAEGLVQTTDDLLVRDASDNTERETQWEPITTWGDGSVKTAIIAAELPAITNETQHTCVLRLGETFSSPSANINLATALSGRTALIKIWAPGNTTTAAHTIDAIDLIDVDRWVQEGPLLVSTRVEARDIPSAAVGGVESVRWVGDIYVTKDGILEISSAFINDRQPYTSVNLTGGGYAICGDAVFGYTIEIDGTILYDQRPASGIATTLSHAGAWRRRVGKKAAGASYGVSIYSGLWRPMLMPDHDAICASEVERPWARWTALRSGATNQIDNTWANGSGKESDPYWNWDLARSAGAVGGRPELGHRTLNNAAWFAHHHRKAALLSIRCAEAAATRCMHYFDWETNTYIGPGTGWPRFSVSAGAGTSPPGTIKSSVNASAIRPHNDFTDRITIQLDHEGSYFQIPALLLGDRFWYDEIIAQGTWANLDIAGRWNGTTTIYDLLPGWRGQAPSATTGIAWGPNIGTHQTRSHSWGLRCITDMAVYVPDGYTNAAVFKQYPQAWSSAYANQIANFEARYGTEIGFTWAQFIADQYGSRATQYQLNMAVQGIIKMLRNGLGGEHATTWVNAWLKYYVGWLAEDNDAFTRYDIRGSGKLLDYPGVGGTAPATTWAEVATNSNIGLGYPDANWTTNTGERAYNFDSVACNLILRDLEGYVDPQWIKMAADAAVRKASERSSTSVGDPFPELSAFYGLSTQYANNNGAMSLDGVALRTDIAPTIIPGQTLLFAPDAEDGDLVGLVRCTGAMPRSSTATADDACSIASQPVGDPFAISPGGYLTIVNAAALPTEPTAIGIVMKTYDQIATGDTNTERSSGTVNVTVAPNIIVPVLAAAGPFTVPVNAGDGVVAHTPTYTNTPTQPVTLTIESGNTGSYFAIDGTAIETTANLAGASPPTQRSLVVRATNDGGFDEETYVFDIVAAGSAPVIANQTVEIEEGSPIGTSVAIVNTGGETVSITIDSGDSGGRWADDSPDAIQTAAAISRADQTQFTLGITAENLNGSDTATITVDVTEAPWVFTLTTATTILFAGSAARRLRDNYTGPLIRAYRAGDATGQDIGFDGNGDLDVAALEAYADGALTVAALYDQSPLAQGLAVAASAGRPAITNGSGVTLTQNGKPTLAFTGGTGLVYGAFKTAGVASVSMFALARRNQSAQANVTLLTLADSDTTSPGSSGNDRMLLRRDNVSDRCDFYRSGTRILTASSALVDGACKVISGWSQNDITNRWRAIGHGTTFTNSTDGTDWSAMGATRHVNIGVRTDSGGPSGWEGNISEVIVTGPGDNDELLGIITNLNTFYGIS